MKKLSGKTDDFMNTFDGWFTTTVDDDVCDERRRRHWDVVYMLGWLRDVDTIIVHLYLRAETLKDQKIKLWRFGGCKKQSRVFLWFVNGILSIQSNKSRLNLRLEKMQNTSGFILKILFYLMFHTNNANNWLVYKHWNLRKHICTSHRRHAVSNRIRARNSWKIYLFSKFSCALHAFFFLCHPVFAS